jgi:glutathione S-transferase
MATRVLITIPISHYCEKARWALDRAGLAYDERRHLQVVHWVAVRRAGGGRTAPVLVCEGVPAWERRAFPLAYPFVARVIDRHLGITPASAAHSEREVRATFDEVGRRLSDGRPYLTGERFTAADLTFAALAAPMLMPPEYGVALPQPDELPAPMAATVRELRDHPAGRHALRMFREER